MMDVYETLVISVELDNALRTVTEETDLIQIEVHEIINSLPNKGQIISSHHKHRYIARTGEIYSLDLNALTFIDHLRKGQQPPVCPEAIQKTMLENGFQSFRAWLISHCPLSFVIGYSIEETPEVNISHINICVSLCDQLISHSRS